MFSLYTVLINSSAVQPPELGNGVRPRILVGDGGGGWEGCGGCGDPPQPPCPQQFLLCCVFFFCSVSFSPLKLWERAYSSVKLPVHLLIDSVQTYMEILGKARTAVCSALNSVQSDSVVVFLGHLSLHVKSVWSLYELSLSHTNTHNCLCRHLSRFSIVLYLQLGCCFG